MKSIHYDRNDYNGHDLSAKMDPTERDKIVTDSEKDINSFWGLTDVGSHDPVGEIKFVISKFQLWAMRKRHSSLPIGVVLNVFDYPRYLVDGKWCFLNDTDDGDFYELPPNVIDLLISDANTNADDCVVARVAKRDSLIYMYFSECSLNCDGGTGGENLSAGVRVPRPN